MIAGGIGTIHQKILVLSFLLSVSIASAQDPAPSDLFRWVRGIEGKDPEGRRSFVKETLGKIGVRPKTIPFSVQRFRRGKPYTISGENIVVSMGKGARNIVVGAHLDAVPGSPGANDNGGGVAVILGLIQSMKNERWNHRIDFCFFDKEEDWLIGSGEFVRTYKDSLAHLAMINLDVEGTGEEVYVGPVGEGDDDVLMPLVRQAAAKTGLPLKEHPLYPPSDHLSFANRRLENISISIVPRGDAELLSEMALRGWKADSTRMPKVLEIMHTPEDKSDHVSPKALKMSFDFTRTLLTLLNEPKP